LLLFLGASNWGNRRPGKYGGGGGGNHASRTNSASLGKGGKGIIVIEMFGSGGNSDGAETKAATSIGSAQQKVDKLQGRVLTIKNQLLAIASSGGSTAELGLVSQRIYTGNTDYTIPEGIGQIKVTVTGGGAGGGGHNGDDAQGGGGAGGTCIKVLQTSDLPKKIKVTIGGGGTRATCNCHNGGGNGGTSSFGSYCIGGGGNHVPTWGIGGSGGSASKGDINLMGGFGHTARCSVCSTAFCARGHCLIPP
jgi:hypothetical protein